MRIFKNDWEQYLTEEMQKPYYRELRQFLINQYRTVQVFPGMYDIFNALHYTSYADTKVLILGQDPYHEPGQAHGMAFSVKPGVKTPPSLVNIYKELKDDIGMEIPDHGYLQSWAKQGVLLLNTCLTVRAHQANSHKGKGWEIFTDRVIQLLNERREPIVFILWGANAKSKTKLITSPQHLILTGAHPSPLSAYNGFFGGRYFSATNEFLEKNGQSPIYWNLNDV